LLKVLYKIFNGHYLVFVKSYVTTQISYRLSKASEGLLRQSMRAAKELISPERAKRLPALFWLLHFSEES